MSTQTTRPKRILPWLKDSSKKVESKPIPKKLEIKKSFEIKNFCPYIYQRGQKKGEECGRKCEEVYCKTHNKYNALPEYIWPTDEELANIDESLLDIPPPLEA